MITPDAHIRKGKRFTVVVDYTGRPGVHNDGDGSREGWFRVKGGSFVMTEPVGSEDWMPLNDYPAAKPTYDFYDTVNAGKTALSNGILVWKHGHAAGREFPKGSVTWHWHSRAPIASYLVQASVGDYSLSEHKGSDGITYYEAQDTNIPAAQQAANKTVMDQQQDVTDFQSQFSGPFPFTSDGEVVGTTPRFEAEEMQGMIAFAGSQTHGVGYLYHENAHQWWGDNVSMANYRYAFFKEGFAIFLGQEMANARVAEIENGGASSKLGRAAFETSLGNQFDYIYDEEPESFWTDAPSDPIPYRLYDLGPTYWRPAAVYTALRLILGPANFDKALQQMQHQYRGGCITEAQEEAAFSRWMPNQSSACISHLTEFFKQWFDTSYPSGGQTEPQITGPNLVGDGFYNANGSCP